MLPTSNLTLRHVSRGELNWSRQSGCFYCSAFLPSAFTSSKPKAEILPSPSTSSLTLHTARNFKYDVLKDSLNRHRPNPYRAWGNYFEFCSHHGPEYLSLEEHQAALRKCVPSTEELREIALRKLREGKSTKLPHMWEYRFQTIVRWMRSTGRMPEINDYNFILEQFAVTGHLYGSRAVFHELLRFGLRPNYRTYGLCLQSAAHRLNLPSTEQTRPILVSDASRLCRDILQDMTKQGTRCSSVNLDLCIRILKESVDLPAFESLLKLGYGIDLNYPDRPPLSFDKSDSTQDNEQNSIVPFSTAALNSTIDILGKNRKLSRMVSAFETLAKPLTSAIPIANAPLWFEDDDEESTYLTDDSPQSIPHADANTTTYNFLIKHSARAGSFVLSRHYVLEALDLDKRVDDELREAIAYKRMEDVQAPTFAMNRGTILPVFGLSGRSKHLPLAQWVLNVCKRIHEKKLSSLSYFQSFQQSMTSTVSEMSVDGEPAECPPTRMHVPPNPSPATSVLNWDLDRPRAVSKKPKRFDISLHISILARDADEIEELLHRAEMTVVRLSERIKERLRRRIWQGKDIYLVSQGRRVIMPRSSWRSIRGHNVTPPPMRVRPQRTRSFNPFGNASSPYFTSSPKRNHFDTGEV